MQKVKHCCCGVPLTVGTSIIFTIHGVMFLGLLIQHFKIPDTDHTTGGVILSILLSIPVSGLFGVWRKQHQWLIPHIILQCLTIGFLIVLMIIVLIGCLIMVAFVQTSLSTAEAAANTFKSSAHAHPDQLGTILDNVTNAAKSMILLMTLVAEIVLGCFTGLFYHFLAVVTSYYKKLKPTVRSPEQMEMNR